MDTVKLSLRLNESTICYARNTIINKRIKAALYEQALNICNIRVVGGLFV